MKGAYMFSFMDAQGITLTTKHLQKRRQRVSENHHFECIKKDGARVTVVIITAPIFNDDGEYNGSIADISDNTEHKKAEVKLKESEELFRALFQQAGCYYMIFNPNTHNGIPTIIDANKIH